MINKRELDTYVSRMGKPGEIGGMTIVECAFAPKIDNRELLDMAIRYGLPEEQWESGEQAINASGFTSRNFFFGPDNETEEGEIVERSIETGKRMLLQGLKATGWDDFDMYIDTSALLPTNIGREIVNRAGFDPDKKILRHYRIFCVSALAAIIDNSTDKSLADARVVIGINEPLSVRLSRNQFVTPAGLAFPSIFSDDSLAITYRPRDFILRDQIISIKDDGGVIKLVPLYNFEDEPSDPSSIPVHYEFVGDSRDILRHSKNGVVIKTRAPDNGDLAYMNGPKTGVTMAHYFYDVIKRQLDQSDNPQRLREINPYNIFLHPASLPVVRSVGHKLTRSGHLEAEVIPFLMELAKEANSSSGTAFSRMRYMAINGLVDENGGMVFGGPGIGSAVGYAVKE
jgi:hypothetical protein